VADLCPTCRRPIVTDPEVCTVDVCTKAVDRQQWRRTECFNRGLAIRDREVAQLKAQLQRAEALLAKSRDAIDLALTAIPPDPEVAGG
jgi:hypothetical protein